MKKIPAWLFVFTALALPRLALAQPADDREAVRQAVLDYVEGIYEVDPARVARSVHPELAKRGFYRRDAATPFSESTMSFDRLQQVAQNYNKEGRLPKDAPKDIVVYDVLDQTATVKLTAAWGIDYMHLAKYDGTWKIVNVLWQSPSAPGSTAGSH
jgi:hypothetical protein